MYQSTFACQPHHEAFISHCTLHRHKLHQQQTYDATECDGGEVKKDKTWRSEVSRSIVSNDVPAHTAAVTWLTWHCDVGIPPSRQGPVLSNDLLMTSKDIV